MKKKDRSGRNVAGPNELGAYIAAEVTRTEQDYQNVRSRALNLVATSGGLVALVTGLLAIAAKTITSAIPTDSRWTIAIAMGSFIASTICALVVNYPQRVVSGDLTKLGALVECHWEDSGWDKSVAQILVTYLISLRKDNNHSAKWLKASITLQIAGIAGLGIATFMIIQHAS